MALWGVVGALGRLRGVQGVWPRAGPAASPLALLPAASPGTASHCPGPGPVLRYAYAPAPVLLPALCRGVSGAPPAGRGECCGARFGAYREEFYVCFL